MGRRPCCDNIGLNKGAWTAEEDKKLVNFVLTSYKCSWRDVPKHAGLLRCGKSCRLRWVNYLRPDLKRGLLTEYEEKLVIDLHSQFGNKWSKIASHMPGRTDNEIKNLWNTHIKKKLCKLGIDPLTHKPLNHPPPTDNHQDHERSPDAELQNQEDTQERDEDQGDEIPLILEESIVTHTDDQLTTERESMDTTNDSFLHEVPMIEPHENNDDAFSIYEVPIIEPYKNTGDGFSTHEILFIEPNENAKDGFSTHEVVSSEPTENANNNFSTHEVLLIEPDDNIDEGFSTDEVPMIEPDENTNNNFSIHELQFIEPEEVTLPGPDFPSSCSSTTCSNTSASTTISMPATNSIPEDLKSFEDWQSDGHGKIYIEKNTGVAYEDDFTDWNWLINDFDIDMIDFELIKSLPDPVTLKNSLG